MSGRIERGRGISFCEICSSVAVGFGELKRRSARRVSQKNTPIDQTSACGVSRVSPMDCSGDM